MTLFKFMNGHSESTTMGIKFPFHSGSIIDVAKFSMSNTLIDMQENLRNFSVR